MPRACHVLIASTAKEMAAAVYEEFAKDNNFYKLCPNQKHFVKKKWGLFINEARRILATMLARNDVTDYMKAKIHEALELDATIPKPPSSPRPTHLKFNKQ